MRLLVDARVWPSGSLNAVPPGTWIRYEIGVEVSNDNQGFAVVVFRVESPELAAANFFFDPIEAVESGYANSGSPPPLRSIAAFQYLPTDQTGGDPAYNGGWGLTNSGLPMEGSYNSPGLINAAGTSMPLTWRADTAPNIAGFQPESRLGIGLGQCQMSPYDPVNPNMVGGFGQDLVNGVPGDGSWVLFRGWIDTSSLPEGTYNVTVHPTNGSVIKADSDMTVDWPNTQYRLVLGAGDLQDDSFAFTVATCAGCPSPCDDDGDGVQNCNDACAGTANGAAVDVNGCSCAQLDDDGDGADNCTDTCPNTPNGQAVDGAGCSCSQLDTDMDGVNDCNDTCANTPGGQAVDGNGCACSQLDTDMDGVNNCNDTCPNTPNGQAANGAGCSCSQLDADMDGVNNCNDLCPGSPAGAGVDNNGCTCVQLSGGADTDGDGVPDCSDECAGTPAGAAADAGGCSCVQRNGAGDSDGDGVIDCDDTCPGTAAGQQVDEFGCAVAPPPAGGGKKPGGCGLGMAMPLLLTLSCLVHVKRRRLR